MKKFVRILALIIAVGTVTTWLATGASRGWTKTSREVRTLDETTGIEAISYLKHFTAGLDFLGAGGVIVVVLAGASFLFPTKSNPASTNQTK